MRTMWLLAIAAVLGIAAAATPRADPKECEVCVNVLENVAKTMPAGDLRNKDKIETAIEAYCSQRLNPRDDKMCYYFKPIKKTISQPFSTGMPKLKVCNRLKQTNAEICEVKYPIKIDKENMDYNKLRVKQLKGILSDRGVDCNGCLEKSDYVKRCQTTEHLEL
ncbi:unnamed protein product [Discosporangium mesarthrocarpum]